MDDDKEIHLSEMKESNLHTKIRDACKPGVSHMALAVVDLILEEVGGSEHNNVCQDCALGVMIATILVELEYITRRDVAGIALHIAENMQRSKEASNTTGVSDETYH